MSGYLLKLAGPPELCLLSTSGLETKLPLSKASISLLVLLAASGTSKQTTRPRIAEALWPDCEPDKSASRVSSAIWRLKKCLGAHRDCVLTAGNSLSLCSHVQIDIYQISSTCELLKKNPEQDEIEKLHSKVQSNSGKAFLEGIDEPWAEIERARCHEIHNRALETLVNVQRQRGDVENSISAAQSLVQEDPYREDMHAVLLDLYSRKGMRHKAIEHYEQCRNILKNDLGIAPGSELSQSYQAAIDPMLDPVSMVQLLSQLDEKISKLIVQVESLQIAVNTNTISSKSSKNRITHN